MTQELANEAHIKIGQTIRRYRKANDLTLRQLAEICCLSANTISMVERGQVSPTVTTLCKIARHLGIPASLLFMEICPFEPVIRRAGDARLHQNLNQALHLLGARSLSQFQEPITAAPQTIFCISGELTFDTLQSVYTLFPGDSLNFHAKMPHCCENQGESTAVAILIVPAESIPISEQEVQK